MVAADMIEMRVAGDTDDWFFGQQRHLSPQAHMAEPGVKKEIPVSPPHVPHVAAGKGLYPGLVDKRYAIPHADGLVPLRCSCDFKEPAHALLAQKSEIRRTTVEIDLLPHLCAIFDGHAQHQP